MLHHGENHHYRPSCSRGSAFGVLCQGDTSKPRECKHLDVRLVNGQKEDSNSVPMATGLIFAMTTHPPYPICLRQVMRGL